MSESVQQLRLAGYDPTGWVLTAPVGSNILRVSTTVIPQYGLTTPVTVLSVRFADGTVLSSTAAARGPMGPTGPTGLQGRTGNQGTAGGDGATGTVGAQGSNITGGFFDATGARFLTYDDGTLVQG